jgi:hypothetical protein
MELLPIGTLIKKWSYWMDELVGDEEDLLVVVGMKTNFWSKKISIDCDILK